MRAAMRERMISIMAEAGLAGVVVERFAATSDKNTVVHKFKTVSQRQ
jgi:hypothetical protein